MEVRFYLLRDGNRRNYFVDSVVFGRISVIVSCSLVAAPWDKGRNNKSQYKEIYVSVPSYSSKVILTGWSNVVPY